MSMQKAVDDMCNCKQNAGFPTYCPVHRATSVCGQYVKDGLSCTRPLNHTGRCRNALGSSPLTQIEYDSKLAISVALESVEQSIRTIQGDVREAIKQALAAQSLADMQSRVKEIARLLGIDLTN